MSVMSDRLEIHKEHGHRVHIYLIGGSVSPEPKFILDFDETSVLVSRNNPPLSWDEPYLIMVQNISRVVVARGYNPDFDEYGLSVSDDYEEEK